ncbi:hypothetical protein PS15p_212319 [Mucor circinelloides]
MLHSHHASFKLKYCDEHPILKTFLLMQMLPSSTVLSPKVAIHFAVFEKLQSIKLHHGYMSNNYAFVKSQNNDNLILANYDIQKYKFLNNGLFNNTQILYRNIKAHVLNDTYSLQHNIKSFSCHACDGADRAGVALDGNFQMKRKNNKRIVENNEEYPSILSATADVTHTFGKNEEVEKFEYEVDDNKEEVCGLDEIDNSFKANGNHDRKKNSGRFDELGLFSMNCARHGIPMRLYDIYGGEGRKYPLACINHLVSTLDSNQKVLIMYDIICLCKEKLESCIPQLKTKDPLYLVTVFHAYAHSMHCQVAFHPRVIDGSGHTDGEGVERFWSICNRFSGVTRSMSKYNRQALITDVVSFFRSNKMLEIPGQIALKFRKSLKKICDLNITNQEFTKLQQQWKEHVAALSTPATPSGIKEMLDRAEKQERTANKSTYIRLAAQYLQLTQKMKDNDQKNIFNSRLISQSNALAKKIRALADKCGFSIITSFDHHYFTGHSEEVREVRYSALNDFFKHIIFSIIIREARLAQPGTSGTATAARIIISLESSKKNAETVIGLINNFVDTYYPDLPDLEKEKMKKKSLGREIEEVKKSAKENNLNLVSPLNNWHILKRNVEEVAMLIDEAKRILANYRAEFESLQQAISSAPTYFIQTRFLEVGYRYNVATSLLSEIAKAQPPCIHHQKQNQFRKDYVVKFPIDVIAPQEIGSFDYPDDVDFTEGGEPNPEEQTQFTIDEFLD